MTIFINGKIKEKSEFMLPPETLPIKFVEKVPDPVDIPLNNIAMCQDPAGKKWLATNRGDVIHMVELTEGFHADYGGAASLGAEPKLETLRSLARSQLPNTVICTNNPEMLDGIKVEFVAGNITQDLDKMEIIGGSATSSGYSWMYWDLPSAVTSAYVRVRMKEVNSYAMNIAFCDGSGATLVNPPNLYYLELEVVAGKTDDVRLVKAISGVGTRLAYESVDLVVEKYYDFEFFFEGDGAGSNRLMAWRNGDLVINFSETEPGFASILSVRFFVSDDSATIAKRGHFSRPFIILTEV